MQALLCLLFALLLAGASCSTPPRGSTLGYDRDGTAVRLRYPLVEVLWCDSPDVPADSDCGHAVKHRKSWNVDSCALRDELAAGASVYEVLANATLDIVLVPTEDPAPFAVDENGTHAFGGLVHTCRGGPLNRSSSRRRTLHSANYTRSRSAFCLALVLLVSVDVHS